MADHNLGNDVETTDEGMLSIDEGMLSVENSGTQIGLKKLTILMGSTAALLTAACSAQEAEVRQVSADDERSAPITLAATDTEAATDDFTDLFAVVDTETAARNAETAARNAETAARNAETAARNAETAARDTETELRDQNTERELLNIARQLKEELPSE